jgi:hypothetical protein
LRCSRVGNVVKLLAGASLRALVNNVGKGISAATVASRTPRFVLRVFGFASSFGSFAKPSAWISLHQCFTPSRPFAKFASVLRPRSDRGRSLASVFALFCASLRPFHPCSSVSSVAKELIPRFQNLLSK